MTLVGALATLRRSAWFRCWVTPARRAMSRARGWRSLLAWAHEVGANASGGENLRSAGCVTIVVWPAIYGLAADVW